MSDLKTEFMNAALNDLPHAKELLATRPEIATEADFYTALVIGDLERVKNGLADVRAKGGPKNWEPLIYVCFSRFANPNSARADDLVAAARWLLEHGADPNSFYEDERWVNNPLPCLYGATGLNNNVALGRLLLAAGARPNDNESLYHSTEHPDLECLKLLLEHGATPSATNALKHILDYENLEGLRLLLKAGADPNESNPAGETALHWAVWRGRSAPIIEELLNAGAKIDVLRHDGRSAYGFAVLSGQSDVAALLKRRGANVEISELDALVGTLAMAQTTSLPAEYHRFLPEFSASHRTGAVRALLTLGVPLDARGQDGGTALHWACWKGYADIVKLLLEKGASLEIEDETYHATPAGWYSHGLQNSPERDGDYAETERLLKEKGAL